MPNGRERRKLFFWPSDKRLKSFLSIPFEQYVFLGDYDAVCSYTGKIIEASIRSDRLGSYRLLSRILGAPKSDQEIDGDEAAADGSSGSDEAVEKKESLKLTGPDGVSVAIEYADPKTQALFRRGLGFAGSRQLGIKISGINLTTHDQALRILEKLSTSIFFQIDMMRGVSLSLIKMRKNRLPTGALRQQNFSVTNEIQFPAFEYDQAPMSLYRYGRNAVGMPLLQFLAYYQVIEFYFPTYSEKEAARKLRVFLKDPAFRPDRDTDIGKLLSTMGSVKGGGYGGERSQLKAAIRECIEPNALYAFLTRSAHFKDFFSKAQKGLTSCTIPLDKKDHDVRDQVADLVYDIRCKIVHTKDTEAGSEIELILPFSKEADLLQYDIELVGYLARNVLVAASSPLKLG